MTIVTKMSLERNAFLFGIELPITEYQLANIQLPGDNDKVATLRVLLQIAEAERTGLMLADFITLDRKDYVEKWMKGTKQ